MALANADHRNQERDSWVKPPKTEQGVGGEADQYCSCQDGAIGEARLSAAQSESLGGIPDAKAPRRAALR